MKLGFSGVGNMSSAIISGLLESKDMQSVEIHAYSPSGPKSHIEFHQKLKWHTSNAEMAQKVDILVLGVKPQMITSVVSEVAASGAKPLLVSLAAGFTLATIENAAAPHTPIIRTMPNTPSAISQGMTGLFANDLVNNEQRQFIDLLFKAIGQVLWLSEEQKFHVLTAISGSGPAYFFQFTDMLIKAGEALGLTHEEASTLAVQTAKGAGLLMAESGKPPVQLQKEVTSPNGTTFAATEVFKNDGIEALVLKAVDAAQNRSQELSQS